MSFSNHKHQRKPLTKRQKLLLFFIVFVIMDIVAFLVTVSRYSGYELISPDKYVSFKMPKKSNLSESEWKTLISDTKVIKYPGTQLEREKTYIKRQYKKRIKEYDMTFEQYLKESGMSKKQFENQVNSMAKENVKDKLVLHAIAEKKGIKVNEAEIEKAKKNMLKEKGVTTESEYKKLTGETVSEHAKEIDIKSKLLYAKIVS